MARRKSWASAGWWLLAAGGFGAGLVLTERQMCPLDDPDPGHQRDGLVVDLGCVQHRLLSQGPSVVLFVRPSGVQEVCEALAGADAPTLDSAVQLIVAQPACPPASAGRVQLVDDTDGSLHQACRMRVPRDGGYPVGFAVVDTRGHLRYQTLDPGLARHLREVAIMAGAVTR